MSVYILCSCDRSILIRARTGCGRFSGVILLTGRLARRCMNEVLVWPIPWSLARDVSPSRLVSRVFETTISSGPLLVLKTSEPVTVDPLTFKVRVVSLVAVVDLGRRWTCLGTFKLASVARIPCIRVGHLRTLVVHRAVREVSV